MLHIGMGLETNMYAIGLTGVSLFIFGMAYNHLVAELEKRDKERGYTAFFVVFGNLVTVLLASMVIGLVPALVVLAAFAASGLPMIVGSVWRHTEDRSRRETEARNIIDRILDAQSRTLAEVTTRLREREEGADHGEA